MKSKVVYCWNCKAAMETKGDYYQCLECGATWNELPAPGIFIDIERTKGGQGKSPAYKPVKRRGTTLLKGKR